jgi:hypothetical protein
MTASSWFSSTSSFRSATYNSAYEDRKFVDPALEEIGWGVTSRIL